MKSVSARLSIGGALALLAGCGATDMLRRQTPEQRFHAGLAAVGDPGSISGIRTVRTWGVLRRPGQEELVHFDEIQVVPHRTVVRLQAGARVWIGESDVEAQRWSLSRDGGQRFEKVENEADLPQLDGELVWGLGRGADSSRLGRVSLPGWFRITEGLAEVALRDLPDRGGAATVEVDLPPLVEGGRSSKATVFFDRHSGRITGVERRFAVGELTRALHIAFENWRELDGIVMPARQVVSIDGTAALEAEIEGARFNDSAWPVWVVEHRPEWTAPPFPWYEHLPEPSDDLYRVQEEMFGTWWQREERGLRAANYDELAAARVDGVADGVPWKLWVSEAGRFREERGERAEIVLFDASDAPAKIVRGSEEVAVERTESAVRSWLFRVLLVRPLVRESLNATYDADGAVRMIVRQGVRDRVDLVLRVVLDAPRVRILRVEARQLSAADGPALHAIDLRYAESGEIAGFTWETAAGLRTVDITRLDRGAAAPLEAFQRASWNEGR
ncbi:MAG: hypothetical protein IPN34_07915 [Planctomycetes bacterium]|nr:hypothetical protein [Planctomycetota bacterium]